MMMQLARSLVDLNLFFPFLAAVLGQGCWRLRVNTKLRGGAQSVKQRIVRPVRGTRYPPTSKSYPLFDTSVHLPSLAWRVTFPATGRMLVKG